MAYNIFEPVNIYNRFIVENNIDTYFKNVVAFPRYLAYNVLPKKHLMNASQLIIENIEDNKQARKSGILNLANSFLNTEQDNDSYNDFLSFSKTLDLMRNEKLDDVCPWLQL